METPNLCNIIMYFVLDQLTSVFLLLFLFTSDFPGTGTISTTLVATHELNGTTRRFMYT